MNTLEAFSRGQAARGNPIRVFDWTKAAEILKERRATLADAGLQGDLEWTGGTILENGVPQLESYTYLASNWAIPILIIDDEEIACWRFQNDTPGWDAGTKWPPEALAIWNGGGQTYDHVEVKELPHKE